MRKYTREQAIAAFWRKVDVKEPGECWPWQGAKSHGYGSVRFLGKGIQAHRLAFLLAGGILADGEDVCHTCDNPPCCNPIHLFAGTAKQNSEDMVSKGRSAKGEKQHRAKLTKEAVAALREDRAQGATYRFLADKYGIDYNTAWMAARGATWKHLPKKS